MPDLKMDRAQPESFRARELSLSLTVKDLTASVAWYRGVVGFTVHQEYEREGQVRSVALKAGDVRILLNQDDGKKGFDRKKGEGFAFQFVTVQDIDGLAKRIKDSGHKLETEPADMPWGTRAFRVVDPDGFRFSISTPRPGA
jgi:uncharacterized glyoxalase superfamily protein PhnB